MNMKEITFIPAIEACQFSSEMQQELDDAEIRTHYHSDILYIDWDDSDDLPCSKEWLVNTFGERIKNYRRFAIIPT